MRKHFKFLIPAILVVALIVSCAVIFASAEDKVVYVSSTGAAPEGVTLPEDAVIVGPGTVTSTVTVTGGDAAEEKFTDVPYYEALARLKALNGTKFVSSGDEFTKASPLYKAFEAIGKGNTGTIIIMDELAIETAERVENGSASEAKFPQAGTVTITTNDTATGINFAEKGAKLVLDQSKWNAVNVQLGAKTVWKDINLEYRYNSTNGVGSWEAGFSFYATGNSFAVEEGVTVTSYDYASGSAVEGNLYPNIFGGGRYANLASNGSAYITIKSGTWNKVFGAGHGLSSSNIGAVKAATITVEGGKVNEINGAGSSIPGKGYAYVTNNLTINVTGGEVGTITTETALGVGGEISVAVSKPAEVEKLIAADSVAGKKTPTSVAVTYDEGYVGEITGFETSEVTKKPNVVFVSSAGTGDGSDPDKPIGNGTVSGSITKDDKAFKTYTNAKYEDVIAELYGEGGGVFKNTSCLVNANALYRAVQALGGKTGTIVLVGPTHIDSADRIQTGSPAEFTLPTSEGTITLTSVYDGKDYRTEANGGAKLVLDRSKWNSINLQIGSDMVWENLKVEHNQRTGYTQTGGTGDWPANFMIFLAGYDFTVGDNVATSSWDAKKNEAGGSYAFIFAGRRFGKVSIPGDGTQDIKIGSGVWQAVYTSGCGMSGTNTGMLTGNVNVTITETSSVETNVAELYAGGFTARDIAGLNGNATFNIEKNARVQRYIYAQSAAGVSGKVVINVDKDADIRDSFIGVYYTDGKTHTLTPAGVELNFYTTAIPEAKIFNVADFEKEGNVYNPIDKQPVVGGTPAVTGDQKAIYVADVATGKGDGSSPDDAIGRVDGYDKTVASAFKGDAIYRALSANDFAIIKNGGVIVLVGETTVDNADAVRASFAEWQWVRDSSNKEVTGDKNITITSYYDGTDYRAQGAKFVFDTSVCGINMRWKAPTTWEYLNVETVIDSSRSRGTDNDGVIMLSFFGNKVVFDEEIEVTSRDVRTSGTKIEKYPSIVGFDRLGGKNVATQVNPDITINSGKFGNVYGGGYGVRTSNGDQYGSVKGNITITVNGGQVDSIFGSSAIGDGKTIAAKVEGDITIAINGGQVVNAIYATNHNGITGKITATIAENAKVGRALAYYQLSDNSNTANKPTDSTITYHRNAISDDKVLYWVNSVGQGEATGGETPPPPAPEVPTVVYISANGTGDGLTPENPLGNVANYDNQKDEDNLFYRAVAMLKNGGTIVVVGDVSLDTAESRVPTAEGQKYSPSEFYLPAVNGKITVTSVYDNADYRENAKLIIDADKCNTAFITMQSAFTFENLNIEYKYDPNDPNNWGTPVAIAANGNELVIGTGVNVTSLNADTNAAGDKYPMILGGHRFSEIKNGTNVTIKSGTWDTVIAGSFGMTGSTPEWGKVNGDATLIVDGGKIGTVYGTGSPVRASNTVTGKVTITLNGGEFENVIFAHSFEYLGTGSVVTLGKGSDVEYADYAVSNYKGDLADLKSRVKFVIENGVVVGEKPAEVLYVANTAKGTGDGSSPENALGMSSDYAEALAQVLEIHKIAEDKRTTAQKNAYAALYTKTALYRAFNALKEYGGIIVLVDDVVINNASSRFIDANGESPSEYTLPSANGKIIITNEYEDYKSDAKLVLDHAACPTVFVTFQSAVTFENVNIEHRYDPTINNGWGTPMTFAANGNKFVIGENVNVTSYNVKDNQAGDFYPMILGGHRYYDKGITKGTNVTIKSGTWSTVVAGSFGMSKTNPGKVTGDAVLNIMGGTIETVYGTSSAFRPYAFVTGTTTINVTGGRISALYGAASNGAEGDIIVNIAETAERVNKAWGYLGTGTAPKNAAITYDRSVVRDDEVKYWNFVSATGNVEDQPEKEYYTVYVADEARGKGDGSSPENAIGATADYKAKYARMLELLAIPSAERTEAQTAEFNTYKNLYKESAFYRALNNSKLVSQGGKLVIVGPVTVDANDSLAAANSNGDFQWPLTGGSQIIITNVDKGVDYREQGAKLVIDRTNIGVSFTVKTPTLWENLDIEYKYDSSKSTSAGTHTMIALNGNEGIFGEGIEITPVDINTTKSNFYPGILGGHRFSDKAYDTNVTIMSGRWGTVYGGNYGRIAAQKDAEGNTVKDENNATVYDSFGYLDGNVNITVTGGKITALIGTSRDDTATCKATVRGDVTIDIKGNAEIVKLYGANRNGIEGKIVVNVTEDAYVGTAWGYHFTTATADKQPTDATLNYVRSAIAEADIKYWTVVNASGEGEPGIRGPVIYIATTSRGTGDGSSPENAMGNDPTYAADRKKALKLMESVDGTASKLSKENQSFVNSVYKKLALYRALSQNNNAIIDEGGTIVVVDELVINSADGMRRSLSEFRWPTAGSKTILITSKYDGVDYRWKGAKVVLDVTDLGLCVETKSPTIWNNIVIEHRYNSKNGTSVDMGALIAAAGNKIEFGYNVKTVANDVNPDEEKRKEIYPSICGGGRYTDFKTNTHVTVNGGEWAMVVGGVWSGTHTGNTTIGIGGGKITTVSGTCKPTSSNAKHIVKGSVWIGLWGGEVGNVYGTGKTGLQWGSVAVGIGKGVTVKGKIYATHPDYDGKAIRAIAYYNEGAINKNKLVGFTEVNPQTGSALVYLSAVAVVALVATGVVISKKRKRITD